MAAGPPAACRQNSRSTYRDTRGQPRLAMKNTSIRSGCCNDHLRRKVVCETSTSKAAGTLARADRRGGITYGLSIVDVDH